MRIDGFLSVLDTWMALVCVIYLGFKAAAWLTRKM